MAYAPAQQPLSILVVDDEDPVREMLNWMLSDAGHSVHDVCGGSEALAHLRSQGPVDLVLSDINMPGMDGLELSNRLRQHWPAMGILLISGRPRPIGVQHFISKPFRWDTLTEAITMAAGLQSLHEPCI